VFAMTDVDTRHGVGEPIGHLHQSQRRNEIRCRSMYF
jgi:hypothetical protein